MKKHVLWLMAGLIGAIVLTGCGKKEAPAAPAPAKAIVIGLDDNFPPMGFRDGKNELIGFDIDLAKEAGKRLFGQIDVKANQLILAIAKTHRREIVIQTNDNRFGRSRGCGR